MLHRCYVIMHHPLSGPETCRREAAEVSLQFGAPSFQTKYFKYNLVSVTREADSEIGAKKEEKGYAMPMEKKKCHQWSKLVVSCVPPSPPLELARSCPLTVQYTTFSCPTTSQCITMTLFALFSLDRIFDRLVAGHRLAGVLSRQIFKL